MSELTEKSCVPCEGGVSPLQADAARDLLASIHKQWSITDDGLEIAREFNFKTFYHTMAFVNAVAWVANSEGHHPDMEVGYDYCRIRFTTHAIGGLSENDFICAAKVDALNPD